MIWAGIYSSHLATKNLLAPISLTVLNLTPKNYSWKPCGATLTVITDCGVALDLLCTLNFALPVEVHLSYHR